MKIVIREESQKTRVFRVPTGLVLNRFSAMLIRRALKKKGATLTKRQTRQFLKELKCYRRGHKDWNLVEIHDKKNQHVQIKL